MGVRSVVFVEHQVEDDAVAGAVGAQNGEVVQRALHVLLHDAVRALDTDAAGAHGRCLTGGIDAGGDLQRAVCLCAVAHHASDIAHHVLDGAADLVIAAAQQVCNAAGRAGPGDGRAAEVAQASELRLDADGDEVGQGDGTQHGRLIDAQPAGGCHDGHRCGDALIAAAGVGHHRHRRACHAGVCTGGGSDHGVGGQVAGHEALAAVEVEIASDGKAVFLGKALIADDGVDLHGAADDVDGVVHGVKLLGAVVPDGADGQEGRDLLRGYDIAVAGCGGIRVLLVEGRRAVLLHQHDVGVQVADDGAAGVAASLGDDLNVELLGHLRHIHLDLAGLDQRGGRLHRLTGDMVHDLQKVDRVAAQRTDGGGIVHALVIGAGDARRHGVLDDVDAGVDRDLLGLVHTGLPQGLTCLGGSQGHSARLGAAGSQLHLTVQDADEHILFHSIAPSLSLRMLCYFTAMHSISSGASLGRRPTCTALRAGKGCAKYSP